jgi:hypothetical protein
MGFWLFLEWLFFVALNQQTRDITMRGMVDDIILHRLFNIKADATHEDLGKIREEMEGDIQELIFQKQVSDGKVLFVGFLDEGQSKSEHWRHFHVRVYLRVGWTHSYDLYPKCVLHQSIHGPAYDTYELSL